MYPRYTCPSCGVTFDGALSGKIRDTNGSWLLTCAACTGNGHVMPVDRLLTAKWFSAGMSLFSRRLVPSA